MRITRPGSMMWTPTDGISLNGWTIDMEGAPQPDERDVLALVLNHIAVASGLRAAPEVDPLAALGLAEDAIERARKAGL